MSDVPRMPSLLFFVTLLFAVFLMAAAAGGPYLAGAIANPHEVLELFGKDMTVRRTAFVSSLGLIATAFVFFRPPPVKKKKAGKDSVNMTGA
jgi:uncharacterized BrkB/YihY/UPF0761 family membrane protein